MDWRALRTRMFHGNHAREESCVLIDRRSTEAVQPYGLIIPDSYDGSKPVRLDVVLHGRGNDLTEVSFIAAHESDKPVAAGLHHS